MKLDLSNKENRMSTKISSQQKSLKHCQKSGEVKPGLLKGKIEIRNDFDAPLPKDLLDLFNSKKV